MNPVYIRLVAYVLAPVIGALGIGHLDMDTMTLTLDLNQLGLALAAATSAVGAIFAKWGKK